MANQLFNQLNQTSQTPLTNLFNQAKVSNNPIQFLLQANPATQQVINEIQASGMSAKDLFYRKAQECGIDPNTILNKLR